MELEIDEEYEDVFHNVLGTMTSFCSKMCGIQYLPGTERIEAP
jgi:hypothetical protein